MYFKSMLLRYPEIRRVESLDGLKDVTLLVNGDYLKPDVIVRLKESGVTLVSFDINDNTLLTDSHRNSPEVLLIDLIFKIGGIQKQNQSQDLSIDGDFNFSLRPRTFLPEADWTRYKALFEAGRLQSLPYVPWNHQDAPERSYGARSGNVLVRGGNHFYRFITFLNLARLGRADARSSFVTADYFRRDMNPQFRYCELCIQEKEQFGKCHFTRIRPNNCTSPAMWGGIGFEDGVQDLESYETANRFNNRCPRSFFWLTEQFEKKHGRVDHALVERALNGSFQSAASFMDDLSQATFYTDLKWLFSIYCPPRFWEAANAGTINLLPRRTNEQAHFPHIEDGVHYLSFLEDFSDLDKQVDESAFNAITGAAKGLFDGWIRSGAYPISERLCRHILTEIERVSETV